MNHWLVVPGLQVNHSYLEFEAKLWDNFQATEWKGGGKEWSSLGLGGHRGYPLQPI